MVKQQDKKAEKSSWIVKEIKEHGIHDPYDDNIYSEVIRKILKFIGGKKLRILDEGCGSSAYGLRFAKLGHSVTGIDISEEIIESAKQRSKIEKVRASFEVGDIEELPFKDSSFDVCLFGGVLHHFPDINKVMQESLRVTKSGGYLVAIEPNKENPHVFLSMEPKSPFRYKHLTVNERSIKYNEILKVLGKNVESYKVFYKLMTLTKKGRHASKSFWDKEIFYKYGGFAWKHVKGNFINKLLSIFAYNVVHLFQRFSSRKRFGNFVIVVVKIKK